MYHSLYTLILQYHCTQHKRLQEGVGKPGMCPLPPIIYEKNIKIQYSTSVLNARLYTNFLATHFGKKNPGSVHAIQHFQLKECS